MKVFYFKVEDWDGHVKDWLCSYLAMNEDQARTDHSFSESLYKITDLMQIDELNTVWKKED